jgi:hypothetical protein
MYSQTLRSNQSQPMDFAPQATLQRCVPDPSDFLPTVGHKAVMSDDDRVTSVEPPRLKSTEQQQHRKLICLAGLESRVRQAFQPDLAPTKGTKTSGSKALHKRKRFQSRLDTTKSLIGFNGF